MLLHPPGIWFVQVFLRIRRWHFLSTCKWCLGRVRSDLGWNSPWLWFSSDGPVNQGASGFSVTLAWFWQLTVVCAHHPSSSAFSHHLHKGLSVWASKWQQPHLSREDNDKVLGFKRLLVWKVSESVQNKCISYPWGRKRKPLLSSDNPRRCYMAVYLFTLSSLVLLLMNP